MEKTTVSAILLAAGSSSRMGENKMLMRFCGKTPVELCVEAFCGIADEAVIAVSPDTEEIALTAANSAPYPVKIVRGGSTRQESVFNAVRAASPFTTVPAALLTEKPLKPACVPQSNTAAALLPCPLRTQFVSAIPEKRLTEAGFLRHKLRKASAEIFF
jgi:2-C-methyl-D-erythritol 4-phosphate cytidylyltransferase